MERKRAFLFDFDYTLADSSRGVISCINYALEKMGLDKVSDEAACKTIGLSLTKTFCRLCSENNEERSAEFARLFVENADKVMADLTCIYNDVPSTLRYLKEKGFKLGIVSTKYRYRMEAILHKSQLTDVFDVIIGGEDVINHKPHNEGITKAIQCLNVDYADTIYVGDSLTDAETVKDLKNIRFVAALTGVTTSEEFSNYNVYRFINNISELVDLY